MSGTRSGALLVGLDIGTARCKAGLFDVSANLIRLAHKPTPSQRDSGGNTTYDPEALWKVAGDLLRDVAGDEGDQISAVGVASMAEAGLLIDSDTGEPATPILPWFDQRPLGESERLAAGEDPLTMFSRSGLHPSPKFALPKLLWLRAQGISLKSKVWLSVADFVVYRLTGVIRTDSTLAARTFAYDLGTDDWDDAWIRHFQINPGLFPRVLASGEPAGAVTVNVAKQTRLSEECVASVAGHDHIVATAAIGAGGSDWILDSMGTAESLIGPLEQSSFGRESFESGLAIVPGVFPGKRCWLGGISAAGASVNWLRELGIEAEVDDEGAGREPTHILFYPYLLGAGAPRPDRTARAAFVGLTIGDRQEEIVQAVLEGVAYEAESIHRAAAHLTGEPARDVTAVGGYSRSGKWLQIKADVTGKRHRALRLTEATALGAALLAGLGSGILSLDELKQLGERVEADARVFEPGVDRHRQYQALYHDRYLPLQAPLRSMAQPVPAIGRGPGDNGPSDVVAGSSRAPSPQLNDRQQKARDVRALRNPGATHGDGRGDIQRGHRRRLSVVRDRHRQYGRDPATTAARPSFSGRGKQ